MGQHNTQIQSGAQRIPNGIKPIGRMKFDGEAAKEVKNPKVRLLREVELLGRSIDFEYTKIKWPRPHSL
jgi:hypothetical protein